MRLLNKEVDKRVIVKLDKSIRDETSSGIMKFGVNNDYPQVIEKLIFSSQTAKACAKIFAKFIAGDGFEDPQIGFVEVGKDNRGKPITLNNILRQSAQSIAFFNGVFIHANENLAGEVGATRVLPFKNCRFSRMDDNGYCSRIAVHENWSKDPDLKTLNVSDISWFNTFNIDAIPENVKDAGGIEKFKGQIYFNFFDDNYLYPLSPFDSVYLDMDTEYQIQVFKNNQIRNGFTDKVIMRRSACEDEDAEKQTMDKIKSWMGADGDNILVFEDEFDENGQLVQNGGFAVDKIPTSINDKLFENWEKSLSNNIRKAINALPAVLIDYEQGQLSQASGEMIIQATNYYNALTSTMRESVSEMIKEIYSHHTSPLLKNCDNWKLKPVKLLDDVITPNPATATGN